MLKEMQAAIDQTRDKQPFVPSMTNVVTVNQVTNAQIAIGASPAVFYQGDEGESFAGNCGALYINLGTLFLDHKDGVPRTVKALKEANKPWLLDPVGIGKGEIHGDIIDFIKDYPPTIIKGNASEIIKLAQSWQLGDSGKAFVGVDAQDSVDAAKPAAISLAKLINSVVVITGEIDFITDGNRYFETSGGSDLMQKITGAGCMLGGVMAGYLAFAEPLIAALTSTSLFNQASEAASQVASGPMSFQTRFLDRLYQDVKAGRISDENLKEITEEAKSHDF